MLVILKKSYSFIQKVVSFFGYNIIVNRREVNSIEDFVHSVRLQQKNIKHLKVVLNREDLLNLLPKNGVVTELGVDKGGFSAKIISFTKPEKLYLIDTWDSERYNKNKMNYVKKRFQKDIDTGLVTIIRGTSERVLKKFENGYFDWVYLDTSHSYKQTVKELELCRKKVKDGGIITGHDYCQGSINKALAYGVVQAVNQFCVKNDWEFIYLTHEPSRVLSFAIKKIKENVSLDTGK